MREDKRKYLEFIQGIISRHNSNSFAIKGWMIATITALYALAGSMKEPWLVFISAFPILLFWGLDAFYLAHERCYVDLYKAAIKGRYKLPKNDILKSKVNATTIFERGSIAHFDLNYKKFEIWKDNTWLYVCVSPSILGLYLTTLITTLIIGFAFVMLSCF